MWEPLQRYNALDAESRRTFWRAAVLLPLVQVSLRLRGYNRTHTSLQRRLNPANLEASPSADVPEQAHKTCRMVRAALHYSPASFTCLEESLTLWYLLRKQGVSSRLRIGVCKMDGKFEAHAWVELGGEALNQPEQLHRHYAAFDKEFAEPPTEPS